MSVPPITCLDSGICQPIPDAGYNYAFQQIPNDPQHSIHKYTNENLTEFNTGEEVIDDHNCRHHHHQPSEYVDELNKVPQPKILSLVTNTQQEKIESSSFSAADSLLTESDHAEKVSLTSQHDFFHFERSHHRGEFNHKHVNHENVHLDTMASFASHGSYFEQFLPSNQTQLGVMSSTHSQANAIDDASVNSHSLSLSTLHQTSTSVPVLFNKTNATASPVHHDNYIQPTTTFQSHSVNIPGICHSASSTMETNNQQKQYLDKPNAGSVNRSSEQLLVEENLPHCLQNAPSFARENTLNTQEHCDAQETFTRTSQNLSLPFNKDHLERTPDKRSLVLQHPNKFSSMKACSEPTVMSTFTSISNNVPAAIVSCTPSSHTMHEPRKDSFPSCCMHSHQLPSHESSETCSSTPCINLGSRYVSRSIGEKDISIRQSVMKLTDQPSSFTPLLACSWTSSDLSSTPIGFSSNMDDDDTAKIQVGVSNHSHSRKHSFENFANDERNELLSHFVISRCNTSDKSKGDCNFHSTSKNNNSIYGSDNGPKHVTSSESAFNLSRQTHFPTAICVTPSLVSSFNSNRTAAVNISPHTAHLASSTTGQHQDNYGKGTTTQKDMTFSKVTSCGGSSNVLTTSSESERTLGKYSETLFHGISSISHDTFTSKSHPDIFLQSQQKNQVRVDEEVHEHQPHQRQSESQSNLQSQEINPVSPRLLSLPENAYCSHLSEKPVTVQRQDKLHQHDTQVNLLSGFHSKRCQYSYQNCFQDSSVYLKTTNDLNSNISWSEEKNKREFNICNNNPYRTPTATAAAEGKNQSGSFFNLHAGHLNSRVCLLEQQLRQAQQQISHLEQQLNNCINQIYQDVIEYVQQNFHHEVFTDILDHLYHHHFGDNASGVSMSSETSKRTTLPTQIRTKLRTIVKQQLEQHSVDFAQLGKGTTLSSVPAIKCAMKQTFIIAKEQLRGLTFVEDSELEKTIKSMFRSQREYWSLSEPDRRKKISRQSVKQRRMRNTTELSSRKRSKVHDAVPVLPESSIYKREIQVNDAATPDSTTGFGPTIGHFTTGKTQSLVGAPSINVPLNRTGVNEVNMKAANQISHIAAHLETFQKSAAPIISTHQPIENVVPYRAPSCSVRHHQCPVTLDHSYHSQHFLQEEDNGNLSRHQRLSYHLEPNRLFYDNGTKYSGYGNTPGIHPHYEITPSNNPHLIDIGESTGPVHEEDLR